MAEASFVTGIRVTAVLFLAIGLALMFFAPSGTTGNDLGDPGPAFLPRIAGLLMILLAVFLFIDRSAGPASEKGEHRDHRIVLLSLLAIPLYYLAFAAIGYTMASALYLFVASCLLGERRPVLIVRYALVATVFSLASGLVFARLLEMPLPGIWP